MLNTKVIKNRRVVLKEWQDDYGENTCPPADPRNKLGKGLPTKRSVFTRKTLKGYGDSINCLSQKSTG